MADRIAKVEIDRELCIGVASCIAIAPEAYELDEENIAIVTKEWQQYDDDVLMQSAEVCPVKAIYLYDKDGEQVYP